MRAIWHEYSGWFDPDRGTTELFGSEVASIAPALCELAGGAERLAERASIFLAEQRPLEALHMLELALAAEPSSRRALEVKRAALELLLQQSGGKNLWERMWIAAELRALESQG